MLPMLIHRGISIMQQCGARAATKEESSQWAIVGGPGLATAVARDVQHIGAGTNRGPVHKREIAEATVVLR